MHFGITLGRIPKSRALDDLYFKSDALKKCSQEESEGSTMRQEDQGHYLCFPESICHWDLAVVQNSSERQIQFRWGQCSGRGKEVWVNSQKLQGDALVQWRRS